jgi:hypothetical protein
MGKYTAQDRRDLADKGHALPDGSFPIADEEDLHSAIRNIGRGNHPQSAKRHIIKRAKALNAYHVLPDHWKANLEHLDTVPVDDVLVHFGKKGMHWGQRKADPERDAKRAARAKESVKRGEDVLYKSNAFNQPSLAIGMKAAGVLMAGVSAGLAIRSLKKGNTGPFKRLKTGMAVTGVLMTGIQAASTLRDIQDIRNYHKAQEQAQQIGKSRVGRL